MCKGLERVVNNEGQKEAKNGRYVAEKRTASGLPWGRNSCGNAVEGLGQGTTGKHA